MRFLLHVALVIEDWRSADNDALDASFFCGVAKFCDRVSKSLRAGRIGWKRTGVVHAVTGENQIRLCRSQRAIQSFAQGGARKSEAFEVSCVLLGRQV